MPRDRALNFPIIFKGMVLVHPLGGLFVQAKFELCSFGASLQHGLRVGPSAAAPP
jgi:hypothetical protein